MLKTTLHLKPTAAALLAIALAAPALIAPVQAAEDTAALASSAPLFEHNGFSVGARVSTLGVGGELGYRHNDWLGVRGSVHYFTFSTDERFEDVDFDVDLDLLTLGGAVDLYPFRSGFRLTGGAFYNANEADLVANPSAGTAFTIGDETFRGEDIGQVDGQIDFRDIAPYAGIGYDGRLFSSVYIRFDGGVMFQGSPRVSASSSGVDPRIQAEFQDALDRERREIEDDVDSFEFYPVVSIGLSYVF